MSKSTRALPPQKSKAWVSEEKGEETSPLLDRTFRPLDGDLVVSRRKVAQGGEDRS